MNVLQVLPELKAGGVERGAVDLAKYLKRNGHRSVVVSAGGPLVQELDSAGISHVALPVHRKSLFSILHSSRALEKIIREEKIDLIHARSRVPAWAGFFAARRAQIPLVTTCHGVYSKHCFSRVMGWGKRVIVVSRVVARRMRDDFGVSQSRLRLIPRGVNLEEFKWSEPRSRQEPVVGVIARLTPIKGHPLFLKAMARVARVMPSVKIRIIGEAPKLQYKEEILALIRHLGLSERVELLGTRYDVPELLSNLSLLVVPSVGEEAFGRVVIEAGACGVPVVATRVGGLAEILEHEKNGLLVGPDDPRFLADAILRVLQEPGLAERLARALRKKVEQEFSLERMFERTLAVYREAVSDVKILVIKLSAVGDVILSVPSLRALKNKFPSCRLSVLVGRKSRKILRHCPYVDDAIAFDADSSRFFSIVRAARILWKENFDMIVDLQNNRMSHLLTLLSGARIRAGHGNRRWSFLLNKKSKGNETLPPLEHQFRVLELLGIQPSDKRLELAAGKDDRDRMRRFLDSQWVAPSQTLVGINPGSSVRWPTKQWPVENFAKLCDELAKRNIRVVITGSADDEPLAEELLNWTRNRPINAVGKTSLTELIELVRRCQVFVSSDSAPMHIASSVDVPLVALFGPTDPKRHLVAPRAYQVFWKEVPCSPCYLRSCPIGLVCMKKISVQEVLDAVLHFIQEGRVFENAESALSGPGR